MADCEETLRELYPYLDGELTRPSPGRRSGTTSTTASTASRSSTSRPSCGSSSPGKCREQSVPPRLAGPGAGLPRRGRRRARRSRRRVLTRRPLRPPGRDLATIAAMRPRGRGLALLDRRGPRRRRRPHRGRPRRRLPRQGRSAPQYPREPGAATAGEHGRRRSTGRSPSGSPPRFAGREPFAASPTTTTRSSPTSPSSPPRPRSWWPPRPGCARWPARPAARVADRAGVDPGQRRVVPAPAATAHRAGSATALGSGLARLVRPQGGRRRGRRAARLDVEPGARPVRPAGRRGRDGRRDQDLVYYVGPNMLGLEKRFGFPPREFRLWLALHEVTHRAQFTGVPWMREHFLGLVRQALEPVDPDPEPAPRRARRTRLGACAQGRDAARRRRPRRAARLARSSARCSTGSAG